MWGAVLDFSFTGRALIALGALMAGMGSIFSGIAALRKCSEKKKAEPQGGWW